MANTNTNLTDLFTAIANAIRSKTSSTETIVADNFPTEIADIRTGFNYNNDEITTIPDYIFYGCEDLNSVDCYNLTSIGTSAFENCTNLKSVILYESVTSVGDNTFKGCSADLVIYCMFDSKPDGWDESWNPDGREVAWLGAPQSWDISATESDNVIAKLYAYDNDGKYWLRISGNGAMVNYTGIDILPWNSKKDNIMFANIKKGVTSIGEWAFNHCTNLTSITISDSVTSIGSYAFYTCKSLTSITIPNSVTSIGSSAFAACSSLTSVTIGNGVTSIGYRAFSGCDSLTSITIPDSVNSIGDSAFYACDSLTSITIPDSVNSIGDEMFSNCSNLMSINIPDSVNIIGDGAFCYCTSLASITIPNSVNIIGDAVFRGCAGLTSVRMPDSVTSIGDSAFYTCKSLMSITIPDSVNSIGDGAFYRCKSLMSIVFNGTIAQWNAITLGSNWNYNVPATYVQCSDGQVAL